MDCCGSRLSFVNGSTNYGSTKVYYGKNVYELTPGVVAGGRMMTTFGAGVEDEVEEAPVTRAEYTLLNAKLHQLTSVLDDLLGNK